MSNTLSILACGKVINETIGQKRDALYNFLMQTQTLTLPQAMEQAMAFIQKEQWSDAENLLVKIIKDAPAPGLAHYFLGGLLLSTGRLQEAIKHSLEAIKLIPNLAGAQHNLGQCYLQTSQFELAVAAFQSAIKLDPSLMDAWRKLVNAYAGLYAWPDLFEIFRVFLRQHPEQREDVYSSLEQIMLARIMDKDEFLRFWESACTFDAFLPQMAEMLNSLLSTKNPTPAEISPLFAVGSSAEDIRDVALLAMAARHFFENEKIHGNWPEAFFPAVMRFFFSTNIDEFTKTNLLRHALGFSLESSRDWNERLFHGIVIPATKSLLDQGEWSLACTFEMLTAYSFGQQPLTEEQVHFCYSYFHPLFDKRIASPTHSGDLAINRGKRLKIAFLAFHPNNSAPDLVVRYLIQQSKLSSQWDALWLCINHFSEPFLNSLKALDISYADISEVRGQFLQDDLKERIEALRTVIANHGVDVLVYYGMYDGIATLASQAKLAPVQIYLSVGGRYYMDGGQWDGYLTGGAPGQRFKDYSGRLWRTISGFHPDPYSTDAGKMMITQGRALRKDKFSSFFPILASIGRSQKIDDTTFMDMLASILNANPNAVFLWFDKKEQASVRIKMVERGISERCLFQGYQKVPLYAQVIDIHLDSFPYPSGLTMFDTMAAGVASVFMDTVEARQTGIIMQIAPLLQGDMCNPEDQAKARKIFYSKRGEELFLLAKNTDEYIAYTQRLISDGKFRKAVGQANLQFMRQFKFDPTRSSREFYQHISEVVEEKRLQLSALPPPSGFALQEGKRG